MSFGLRLFSHLEMRIAWMIHLSPYKKRCQNVLNKHRIISKTNKKKQIQFFKIILANGFSQNWFSNNVLNRDTILFTRFNFMSLKRIGIALQFLTWHTLRFNYFYHYMYPSIDNNKISSITFKKKFLISKQQKDIKSKECDVMPIHMKNILKNKKYRITKFHNKRIDNASPLFRLASLQYLCVVSVYQPLGMLNMI